VFNNDGGGDWEALLSKCFLGNNASWLAHIWETWLGNNVSCFAHLWEIFASKLQGFLVCSPRKYFPGNNVSWLTHSEKYDFPATFGQETFFLPNFVLVISRS
jgi:hypothetical protein